MPRGKLELVWDSGIRDEQETPVGHPIVVKQPYPDRPRKRQEKPGRRLARPAGRARDDDDFSMPFICQRGIVRR